MKIYYSDTFELPLPEKHRFPMAKYRLLRERVASSGRFDNCDLLVPAPATDEQLTLVHCGAYLDRVINGNLTDVEIRRIGFPWSPQLVERSRRSVGASIAAGFSALDDGVSINLAGGTHHAFPDAGQGYCVFNDTVVAARTLQSHKKIERALFIDCDVHQGNGTAAITEHDPSLFSFSIHCEKNFPFRKHNSDVDVALAVGADDRQYLSSLESALVQIPQMFDSDIVFYVSGADAYHGDRLGHLQLTKQGLLDRDRIVFDFCRCQQLPVAVSMAGGYATNVEDVVDIHFETVGAALDYLDAAHQICDQQ